MRHIKKVIRKQKTKWKEEFKFPDTSYFVSNI